VSSTTRQFLDFYLDSIFGEQRCAYWRGTLNASLAESPLDGWKNVFYCATATLTRAVLLQYGIVQLLRSRIPCIYYGVDILWVCICYGTFRWMGFWRWGRVWVSDETAELKRN
jgi:hypothetical protein